MTHSLKTFWITIFSIFAMLMSTSVSSASTMEMQMMDKETMSCHHASMMTHAMSSMCDVSSDDQSMHDMGQHKTSHCSHGGDMGANCCVSICLSWSYPIQSINSLSSFAYSLAPHHSVIIGSKVARIQSILRPPSA
ncbi:hypothetical protein F2Z80_17825 [Vibrio fortis]|uniref:DUF2946 domain-containing protein n=1 Tax=Vibrio fortis TaxID=212667 RepID=A0A5N3S330_9VIBR|nr:hypothetical protein [Vibrio fortis]KAB0300947.1 hypothetical protein F2Z80_17825 [Vibrio fortis]